MRGAMARFLLVLFLSGAGLAVTWVQAMAVEIRTGETRSIAVARPDRSDVSVSPNMLAVVVKRFVPSAASSSELVLRAADTGVEIGRVGIFPNDAFDAGDRPGMTFLVPLPAGVSLRPGAQISVGVQPIGGQGGENERATVDVGQVFMK